MIKLKGIKSNQKLILLLAAFVLVVGGLIWWSANDSKDNIKPPANTQNTPEAYKRMTTIPTDWKTYSNPDYFLEVSYPASWRIVPDSKGNPTMFDYEIGMSSYEQGFDAMIGIKKNQSLEVASTLYKRDYLEKGDSHPKVLNEKSMTIDGNPAKMFRFQQGTGAKEIQFMVAAHGNVYMLPLVYESDVAGQITSSVSLQIMESVKIN